VIGDVEGRTPIIIEDIIDTGNTIVNVVESLKERGASPAIVCATHGLFSADGLKRLEHPHIRNVVVTNSIAIQGYPPDWLKVLSVAPILSTAVRIILESGSLANLFRDAGV
jgi:ribose-phosphate pyrophosphokinase